MSSIEDIMKNGDKKPFKPKNYRAWSKDNFIPPDEDSKVVNEEKETSTMECFLSVKPSKIKNWEFHDRPEAELGDIQALANDFIKVGQQQPCVVRPSSSDNSSGYVYELIIGERRWRAAILAGIDLKVIVKNDLSDVDAALAQAAENDNRVDLSDYAKGISFFRLIEDKVIKQKDLVEKLGRSKQYVSALLSFSKIPKEIIDTVNDWSKVSSKTAEKIKQLSSKGDSYIAAILSLSSEIKSKKIGVNNLEKQVLRKIEKINIVTKTNKKIFTNDGRHVFTWRLDNNGLPSMHFPKHINNLFAESKIDTELFTSEVTRLFEQKLKEI